MSELVEMKTDAEAKALHRVQLRKGDGLNDPVNHPPHYTSDPSGVECIQITQHRNFCIGNAIKYLWRAGLKDSAPQVQDLQKAVWYINQEIERIQNAQTQIVDAATVRRSPRQKERGRIDSQRGRKPTNVRR